MAHNSPGVPDVHIDWDTLIQVKTSKNFFSTCLEMVPGNYRFQTSQEVEIFLLFRENFMNPANTRMFPIPIVHYFQGAVESDHCPGSMGPTHFPPPAVASLGQQALFFPHISGLQSETSYESLQQSIILTITLFFVTWENTPVFSNAVSAEN